MIKVKIEEILLNMQEDAVDARKLDESMGLQNYSILYTERPIKYSKLILSLSDFDEEVKLICFACHGSGKKTNMLRRSCANCEGKGYHVKKIRDLLT